MKTKNMTLYSACFLAGFIAALISSPVNASESPPSATRFTVKINVPSCSVSSLDSVSLGKMTAGKYANKEFAPFSVNVTCPKNMPTVVYATAQGAGVQLTDNYVVMLPVGVSSQPDQSKRVNLQLINGLRPLILGGGGKTSNAPDYTFCAGDTTRSCELIPKVNVQANTQPERLLASIQFTLRHP